MSESNLKKQKAPAVPSADERTFDNPEYYFNRELSWLDFNYRCIEDAYDANNPLLEQLNFLAIGSSNLDEFFMVRVAGVIDQYLAGVEIAENKTYMSPNALLEAISVRNQRNVSYQYKRYHELMALLPNLNYKIKKMNELSPMEKGEVDYYFKKLVLPTLSPLGIDAYRPFPQLVNKAINIYIRLEKDGEFFTAILPIPQLIDRYFIVDGKCKAVVLIEDIIQSYLEDLFEGYTISYAFPFRITRNADFEISEDGASDLLVLIEDYIQQRKNGMAVRLEVDFSLLDKPEETALSALLNYFELEERALYSLDGPLDLTFLYDLRDQIGEEQPEHLHEPYEPFLNPNHIGENLFKSAKDHDIFLHHPYDSFQPVIELVRHAAQDPQTVAIKQTLYRVSKNSPIIAALKQAAQNGIEVTVLVELKARFDEENNVYWARELEEAGCHVLYGVSELKTHSKITLIIRKEGDKLQPYLHLGTGNYNDKTATLYTDMGIITTHPELTEDASAFFNYLSGFSQRPDYQHLHVSPFAIRDSLMDYIDEEIKFQKENGNGRIIAKMNSLTDKPLIQKLYEASQAGVKIDLIVRGICCLRPGIPGVSENIQVRSIVGRLLEHSRIYYFYRNGQDHLFLSSADMMTRNMINRVEIEFPILDKDIGQEIIDYLELQLSDTLKARELNYTGEYTRPVDANERKINSQEVLIDKVVSKQNLLKTAQRSKNKHPNDSPTPKAGLNKRSGTTSTKKIVPNITKLSLLERFFNWLRNL